MTWFFVSCYTAYMRLILESLYFMLPAYAANMAPVFAARACKNRWSRPISKQLLGAHKTYRGFIVGILVATGVVYLQRFWMTYALVPYGEIDVLVWGPVFGFGALGGDAVKSFFKRRRGLPPGARWMPWDQIDFILGALIGVSPLYLPDIKHILIILIISPLLHIISNFIGYQAGFKETQW